MQQSKIAYQLAQNLGIKLVVLSVNNYGLDHCDLAGEAMRLSKNTGTEWSHEQVQKKASELLTEIKNRFEYDPKLKECVEIAERLIKELALIV